MEFRKNKNRVFFDMFENNDAKKRTIRVAFSDVSNNPNYDITETEIYNILNKHYNLVIDNESPDFLIFSIYGTRFFSYKKEVIKIFYTVENVVPNFNYCDYAVSFLRDSIGGRNFFHPLAVKYMKDSKPSHFREFTPDDARRKFCSFVASQENGGVGAGLRKLFCEQLMREYKHVDCAGKVLHNCDSSVLGPRDIEEEKRVAAKIKYISQYKFNIAFENSNSDGYITEKIAEPLMAGTVPIYWGSEGNIAPFPENAIIYANRFPDIKSLIEYIKYVDENDDVYMEILRNNPLRNYNYSDRYDALESFIVNIIENGKIFEKDPMRVDALQHLSPFAVLSKKWLYRCFGILKIAKRIFPFIR